MLLVIDVGNTHITMGVFEGKELKATFRTTAKQPRTSDEYGIQLCDLLEHRDFDITKIEDVIVSSVVPGLTQTLRDAVIRLTGKQVMVVGPGIKTGLKILLDNPAQLGSDRVADAVAAVHNYPCPLIIVDMGTATTVSVIDRNQSFLGGMIIPGLRVSLDSLTSRTSQLPNISLDPPKKVIGSNTVDCMRSGIIYSNASSIDGIIDRIEEELGEKCTVISTGGLSKTIIPYCKHDIIIDDMLLLKGLMIIFNKNISK